MRLCLLICLILFAWPAFATPETPTLGIGGDGRLAVGQPAQILVSHATYPHLEDFVVSATYQPNGPLPQTEQIGHADGDGKLNWTPRTGGPVRLKAVAPGTPPLEISRTFEISGGHTFPNWYHMLGIVLGILAAFFWRRRTPRPQPPQTAAS